MAQLQEAQKTPENAFKAASAIKASPWQLKLWSA
jgi:hypothetical protein